jgi:PhnB protein
MAAKKKKAKPIPDGYHAITPYLSIRDAASAIAFYTKAFGAKLKLRMDAPGGKIGHAEIKIGDSIVMLADESQEMDFMSPKTRGGTSILMYLYVKDVDATVAKAVSAGAKVTRPVKDQFYGDRSGEVEDPFGHRWYVATHVEEVTVAQVKKRMADMMKKSGNG